MTGDGPATTPARAGTLVVLGATGPAGSSDGGSSDAGPSGPERAADLLAAADVVFTGPAGPGADPESTVLFYVEAWRVEPVRPGEAARRIAEVLDGAPGRVAVLVTAGPPSADTAMTAALDGLRHTAPGIRVRDTGAVALLPPRRVPLGS
ncbi:hypothetical protein EV383_1956 [Pseudonocardia sediminis]|uniref:Uncharacterized protein n=1 Tax=Pseudonocardia sediminis TaxID=1397368 RepID=A0A4Q7UTF5_PSEST|nr:hypothetical protein [Pseudonocardia sediminis]RZT85092.1 hypothetical protein EV383_1956 [Pseudonocardia sediminis]